MGHFGSGRWRSLFYFVAGERSLPGCTDSGRIAQNLGCGSDRDRWFGNTGEAAVRAMERFAFWARLAGACWSFVRGPLRLNSVLLQAGGSLRSPSSAHILVIVPRF